MRAGRGFTLLELLVVIVILGLMATVVFASIEGLSPRYALRSLARQLGSQIHWARSETIASGKVHHLHYDLEKKECWMILPPEDDEDPELPLDERETVESIEFAMHHVEVEKILLPGGEVINGEDEIDIPFDPLGFEGSHYVYLKNSEGELLVVKFDALLGLVDYTNEEAQFQEF